jgi:hypothetical protein
MLKKIIVKLLLLPFEVMNAFLERILFPPKPPKKKWQRNNNKVLIEEIKYLRYQMRKQDNSHNREKEVLQKRIRDLERQLSKKPLGA